MRAYTIILLLLLALLCSCCKSSHLEASLISLDSLSYSPADSAAMAAQGIRVARLNAKQALLIQPQQKPGKIKNSYNTDNSQKKSNNTKAKGEAIIGNDNAPIRAKKQAVVGDGNTVEQEEEGLPWWVWLPLTIVLGLVYLIWRWFRRKASF